MFLLLQSDLSGMLIACYLWAFGKECGFFFFFRQEFRGLVVLFIGIANLWIQSQGLTCGILLHWCNKIIVMLSWWCREVHQSKSGVMYFRSLRSGSTLLCIKLEMYICLFKKFFMMQLFQSTLIR